MLADHILFIDSEAIIVDKPAGLPVDPPRDGSLSVQNHLQALMMGYRTWPQPAHRLDRDTSGCLMLGRSPKAHRRLSQAFADGQVRKTYLALLDGVPAETSGTITLPLVKRSTARDGWRMVADANDASAKAATTHWHVIAVSNGLALVELAPDTGRTHQLRVHAASGIGHPIVGDSVYGRPHAAGMMLHASAISLDRATKEPVAGRAPFPARFAALGFGDPHGT